MALRKLVTYILQGTITGLIVGFLLLYFFVNRETAVQSPTTRPVVEFKETRSPPAPAPSTGAVASYATAVQAAAPAVANIYTTKIVTQRPHPLLNDPFFRRFFGDSPSLMPRRRLENSLGSAVIVSAEGYLLTNNHVVEGADEIEVALYDGRTARASVVGTDPESDLAVIKVDITDLPSITLEGSNTLQVGDVVLAIGNPYGVGQTVTMGIVSATGRTQLGISTFENFIQTDAAINPGNSGGALVNAYGHLVGINTAIFSRSGGSQGIGFAIPVSLAKDVMQQIIEHGHAIRGWLGIEAQDLTLPLAESFGLSSAQGVLVAGVVRGGPADTSGVRPGDVITQFDGQAITSANEIMTRVAQLPPDTVVTLQLIRNGQSMTLKATIGRRPTPETPR